MMKRVSSLAVLGMVALLGADAFANRGAIEVRRGSEVEQRTEDREARGERRGETLTRTTRRALEEATGFSAAPRISESVDHSSETGGLAGGVIRSRAAEGVGAPVVRSEGVGNPAVRPVEAVRVESLAELNLRPSVKAEIESLELSGEQLQQTLEIANSVSRVDAPLAPAIRDRAEDVVVNNAKMQKSAGKALVTADFMNMCLVDFGANARSNALEIYGSEEVARATESGNAMQVREALVLKANTQLEDDSMEQTEARIRTIEEQCNRV